MLQDIIQYIRTVVIQSSHQLILFTTSLKSHKNNPTAFCCWVLLCDSQSCSSGILGMPDYSKGYTIYPSTAGRQISGTAPEDGWICMLSDSRPVPYTGDNIIHEFFINGHTIRISGTEHTMYDSVLAPIKKGDTWKIGGNHSYWRFAIFYPMRK